ncbi:hydrogen peroxide-inducible genes activator [Phenylobacterium sp.]|uniref:hydrogen peroxide-inducible genes activator n=1 Tax=Phenylobacterium sp. TaxID=1871053 RepID=UPI002E2EE107|nr:hydrogen peroxide-inducible genes activator [Phenylobacterium sp.]
MELPSLRQLQYLISLHDHQHFGRAADACNVTQSTLSSGLKELEATLGMRLVERTRRVVVFTPVGVSVAHRAREILLRTRELALLGSGPLAGVLQMSVIPTIAPFLLPRILSQVRAHHPGLEVQIQEEMSREGCANLSSGRSDCLLLALPYDCGDFEYVTLFDDPIVVALRADDPLAAAPTIESRDLAQDKLLLLHEGHCLRDHALKACRRPDQGPRSAPGASIHTLVQLVNAGMGVTLLPQMAVDAGVVAGTEVVTRPLTGGEARRIICLAWRRNSPRAEGLARLALTLRNIDQGASSTAPERRLGV